MVKLDDGYEQDHQWLALVVRENIMQDDHFREKEFIFKAMCDGFDVTKKDDNMALFIAKVCMDVVDNWNTRKRHRYNAVLIMDYAKGIAKSEEVAGYIHKKAGEYMILAGRPEKLSDRLEDFWHKNWQTIVGFICLMIVAQSITK